MTEGKTTAEIAAEILIERMRKTPSRTDLNYELDEYEKIYRKIEMLKVGSATKRPAPAPAAKPAAKPRRK